MGLGNGGPYVGRGLAVSLAEQLVRLRGKFLSPAEMLGYGHWRSFSSLFGTGVITTQAHRRTPTPTCRTDDHQLRQCGCQFRPVSGIGPRAGLLA